MKCLFCYDGPLEMDSQGNYYGTVINDKVFKRYETLADKIDVAIRVNNNETPNMKSIIKNKNVKIHKINNISSLKGQVHKKDTIKKLNKIIEKVDFLIIRLPSFIGNECEKIARKLNKPYLIEMVGCPWDSFWNYNVKGKIIAPIMWFKTKKNLKNAPYVIYVTNNFLQSRYPTKGKYVCCSNVELSDKSCLNSEKLNRYNNLTKKDEIILGTSAAVDVPYKGQACVIKALPNLIKKGFNVKYEMAGGGDQTALKNLAKKLGVEKHVVFKGLMAHEDVFDWLKQVDIYIQPSKQEGLPRALIEAMNSTCFCLGSNTGGIPELLSKKFVFSNKKNNYLEIVALIEKHIINVEEEAKRNFNTSLQYEKTKIQSNRNKLLKIFAKEGLKM